LIGSRRVAAFGGSASPLRTAMVTPSRLTGMLIWPSSRPGVFCPLRLVLVPHTYGQPGYTFLHASMRVNSATTEGGGWNRPQQPGTESWPQRRGPGSALRAVRSCALRKRRTASSTSSSVLVSVGPAAAPGCSVATGASGPLH
jgi:hypothetical protein